MGEIVKFVSMYCFSIFYVLTTYFLSFQHLPVFKQIIRDVFAGLPEPPGINTAMSSISHYDVESAVEKAASEYGLIPHKAWRDKCMQLYNVAQVHQGNIYGLFFKLI